MSELLIYTILNPSFHSFSCHLLNRVDLGVFRAFSFQHLSIIPIGFLHKSSLLFSCLLNPKLVFSKVKWSLFIWISRGTRLLSYEANLFWSCCELYCFLLLCIGLNFSFLFEGILWCSNFLLLTFFKFILQVLKYSIRLSSQTECCEKW